MNNFLETWTAYSVLLLFYQLHFLDNFFVCSGNATSDGEGKSTKKAS